MLERGTSVKLDRGVEDAAVDDAGCSYAPIVRGESTARSVRLATKSSSPATTDEYTWFVEQAAPRWRWN
jgi:hypothetical protein